MDIVHAHAAKNTMEGIGEFDGTDYQFFHSGGRGEHPAWGTKLFDYHKPEVLHFLLSNVKYWLTEYHLDGFRFDGVTSMLYHSHGLGTSFDNYHKYFSLDSDLDAVAYLQLAAEMCKEVKPDSVLIAEDMSGLPGMCLPVTDGGLGFDYRLGMGLPDFFIKLLKERKDEDWHMGELWNELTSRRPKEKVIAYCESHDQALVGDKTIIFWLADKEMYWQMGKGSHSEVIDRAMSMHKMIRLLTCAAGGDGYLNFMGNEFGHPEWIDFPREGNGWSYYYARRQWSLADNSDLRYSELQSFDAAMIHLTREKGILTQQPKLIAVHEDQKTLAFERGGLIFLINFHPEKTFTYKLSEYKQYKVVLHTAWDIFGGHVDHIKNEGMLMPAGAVVDRRSAMVLERTFDSL
ncbi:4-alpha-glucan-branching enzyme [Holotrichia oblita]|nr:4-alpha-glucan-branching enzyme [Holotrichia oblita]